MAGKDALPDGQLPDVYPPWELADRQVHAEFGKLFALKVVIFFTELLSVLLTPFVLLFSLPPCAGAIIDFFREFTVHVDGVGYVCSFAVFDFKRHGNLKAGDNPLSPPADEGRLGGPAPIATRGSGKTNDISRDRGWRSNENKMEKSFLHFKATHPDWQPSDPASSIFLDRLVGMHQQNLDSPRPRDMGEYPHGSHITAQGRGLGLEERKRGAGQRSRSYERAWMNSPGVSRLETMKERQESEEDEEDEWNKKVKLDESGDAYAGTKGAVRGYDLGRSREEEDEGFLKDVGMMGLLQQVMKR